MLAEKIISFNKTLDFKGQLPDGISVMNPLRDSEEALHASSAFYRKYFNDNDSRHLILGINPGRFGGGITGIPFTDPKRLSNVCGIPFNGVLAHEPSSAFIYEMIDQYGGPANFYKRFLISAISPLGFTSLTKSGREINYNYYDSIELQYAAHEFILESLNKQLSFGINTDICYCLGTGKNFKFFLKINALHNFFKKIIPLEHPRYIMQYKLKTKQIYIVKYLKEFERSDISG
jgi:hypothetical protein